MIGLAIMKTSKLAIYNAVFTGGTSVGTKLLAVGFRVCLIHLLILSKTIVMYKLAGA